MSVINREALPTDGYYGSRIVTSPLRRVRDDGYYGSRVVTSPVRRVYRDELAAPIEPGYTSARVIGDYAPIAPRYIGGTVLSGSVTRRGYYGDYAGAYPAGCVGYPGTRISDSVLRRRYYGGYGDFAGGYGGRLATEPYYGSRVIYDDRYAPVVASTSGVATATATTVSAPMIVDAPTRVIGDRLYDYPVRRGYGDYYDGYYGGYGGYGSRSYAGGYYDGGYGLGGYGGVVGGSYGGVVGGAYGGYGGYLGGYYGGSRYVSSVPRSIVRGGEYIGRYGNYIPYEPVASVKPAASKSDAPAAEKKQ